MKPLSTAESILKSDLAHERAARRHELQYGRTECSPKFIPFAKRQMRRARRRVLKRDFDLI